MGTGKNKIACHLEAWQGESLTNEDHGWGTCYNTRRPGKEGPTGGHNHGGLRAEQDGRDGERACQTKSGSVRITWDQCLWEILSAEMLPGVGGDGVGEVGWRRVLGARVSSGGCPSGLAISIKATLKLRLPDDIALKPSENLQLNSSL